MMKVRPATDRAFATGLCGPCEKRAKSDQIDGVVGEMSRFYESFGFYGHGVSVTTALVPDGWRERLVPLSSPATGAAAWLVSGAP